MFKQTLVFAVAAAVVVAAVSVSAERPKWHELTPDYDYKQYLADFGKKSPADGKEYAMREREFRRSLREALVHNADATQTWKKGINHISDWTDAERKSLRGGRAGEMSYVREEMKKKPSYLGAHVKTGVAIPASYDWRNVRPSVVSAVKDQGMCGSCWAHASTETIESHYALATGQLYVASQQQVTSCAPNPNDCGGTGKCEGSIAELAYDYITSAGGQAQEWTYPYLSYDGTDYNCKSTLPSQPIRINGYKDINKNDEASVLDALISTGPLAVNVDASMWSSYETGVYSGCHYANNISIDHVVQLVGYGTQTINGQPVNYLTIRNSWSPGWGDQGYIKLLRTTNCGWNVNPGDGVACKPYPQQQYVCGECGVYFSVSYPRISTSKKDNNKNE